jgi:hypothetical protein
MAALIPQLASQLPGGFQNTFWTIQLILNAYGLMTIGGWYKRR